jgi:hypothetical protein
MMLIQSTRDINTFLFFETVSVGEADEEAATLSMEPADAALMTPRTRTISKYVTTPTVPSDIAVDEQCMDLEILDRKMRRLVQKLKKVCCVF